MASQVEYDPKNMVFRRLGRSGLRVPLFSIGAWLSFGRAVTGDLTTEILKTAFENGINMIDCAEGYENGDSEREVGRVIREQGWRRSDLIITTKIFFGVGRKGPNDTGLSRKHLIEGLNESLQRLGLDYVDIVFAHRPDNTVPMHEIVRAFNFLINQGKALYWATSEWSARQIEEAHHVATELLLIPPIAEQLQYNALHRQRFEEEHKPLYEKYGYGTTIYSALHFGILTGKYNDGIPEGSRMQHSSGDVQWLIKDLQSESGKAKIEKVRKLTEFAEKEFGCSVAALSLAWAAKHPNTSTVILGATKPQQILENLKALEILPKLTDEKYAQINEILDNKPAPFEPLYMGR
jgi:voltage-dependent potassium channel beta subunit